MEWHTFLDQNYYNSSSKISYLSIDKSGAFGTETKTCVMCGVWEILSYEHRHIHPLAVYRTFDGILVTPGDESGEHHQMMIMVPTAYIWESAVQWIYDNTSSIGSNPNMRNETYLLRKSSIYGKWSDQNNDSNNKFSYITTTNWSCTPNGSVFID